jgi:hypothetical protein
MKTDERKNKLKIAEKYKINASGPDLVRKGIIGDWRNYFDNEIHQAFLSFKPELIELLEYYK